MKEMAITAVKTVTEALRITEVAEATHTITMTIPPILPTTTIMALRMKTTMGMGVMVTMVQMVEAITTTMITKNGAAQETAMATVPIQETATAT